MSGQKGRRHPDDSWPDRMERGDFWFMTELDGAGERTGAPKRIFFQCPRDPRMHCSVPIAPHRNPNGATWRWNGDKDAPTLTPSINCVGGCGWHGWIRAGVITDA